MGDSSASGFGQNNLFSFMASHKRTTIITASALAAATVITVGAQAQNGSSNSTQTTTVKSTVQTDSASSNPAENLTDNTASSNEVNASVNAGVAGSANDVKVTVNGQDVAVPENGSTQRTVPTADGIGQTSVNVTNNGSAGNSSSSSLNVNVNSNSSSSTSGFSSQSTIVTQNGGTTFVTSN